MSRSWDGRRRRLCAYTIYIQGSLSLSLSLLWGCWCVWSCASCTMIDDGQESQSVECRRGFSNLFPYAFWLLGFFLSCFCIYIYVPLILSGSIQRSDPLHDILPYSPPPVLLPRSLTGWKKPPPHPILVSLLSLSIIFTSTIFFFVFQFSKAIVIDRLAMARRQRLPQCPSMHLFSFDYVVRIRMNKKKTKILEKKKRKNVESVTGFPPENAHQECQCYFLICGQAEQNGYDWKLCCVMRKRRETKQKIRLNNEQAVFFLTENKRTREKKKK